MTGSTDEQADYLSGWLKAAQAIILPLAFWVAIQVWTINAEVAENRARLNAIQENQARILGNWQQLPAQMNGSLDDATADLVTVNEARSMNRQTIEQLRQLERDVRRAERALFRLYVRFDSLRTVQQDEPDVNYDRLFRSPDRYMEQESEDESEDESENGNNEDR